MHQSSNKQHSSTIYLILHSKNFVTVLFMSNKYYFSMLLGKIWESATPLCIEYINRRASRIFGGKGSNFRKGADQY